jgi:hypothetical protein
MLSRRRQGDDGAPALVLREVVQRRVASPISFAAQMRSPARVRAAVPHLKVSQLPSLCLGDEGDEPRDVDVGDPELGASARAFLAHDQPHPGKPAAEVE